MKNALHWAPRILMIVFIPFISLFAMDAFEGNETFFRKLGAFFIHLIPTFVLVILLILSWRREWIGGIAFFLLGVLYVITAWGRFPLVTYILISGPLFLVAILFWINWIQKGKPISKNSRELSTEEE